MGPAHYCKKNNVIRWGTFLGNQLSNLYLLPVTDDGVIRPVEPSAITHLHAVVSTLNIQQICPNG